MKLVRRKHDARVYALKSLLKTQMIARLQVGLVRAERDILAEAESPCAWILLSPYLFLTAPPGY